MPHEQSPLTLLSHRFLSFSCEASREQKPEGSLVLTTKQDVSKHSDDPLRWMVELNVKFIPSEKDTPTSYEGHITIRGHFQVYEKFKEENREALVRVTGSSMLYGACREMLANFTARSTHGTLSLPSISFRESIEQVKKKKTTDKTRT